VRTVTRIFALSASFSLVVAATYWFVSGERAGSLLLLSLFFSPLLIAGYLGLQARRAGTSLPQDEADAGPGAAAGQVLGRFHAGSAWPVLLAVGSGTLLMGLVFGLWLTVIGVVLSFGAVLGLIRESHAFQPAAHEATARGHVSAPAAAPGPSHTAAKAQSSAATPSWFGWGILGALLGVLVAAIARVAGRTLRRLRWRSRRRRPWGP
jgi:hypothetical protein